MAGGLRLKVYWKAELDCDPGLEIRLGGRTEAEVRRGERRERTTTFTLSTAIVSW